MMQKKCLESCVRNMGINNYKIVLTDMAKDDLEETYNYISNNLKEPNIANKLMDKIEKDILKLKQFPFAYSEIHIKPKNKIYRRLVTGNYVVLYRVEEEIKQVVIFHIFYEKRDYLA